MKKLLTILIISFISIHANAQNASLFKDIIPGSNSSSPALLITVGDKIFFRANDGIHGQEVWVTDGTPEGTQLVKDIASSNSHQPDHLTAFGDYCIFLQNDGTGRKLWVSDGTEQNTYIISPAAATSISLFNEPVFQDRVYYIAHLPLQRTYSSSLQPNDIVNLSWDYATGSSNGSSITSGFIGCNQKAYFAAQNEPHYYDAIKDSVYMLKDVMPGPSGSFPTNFACNGDDRVFYVATLSQMGRQLMVDTLPLIIRNDGQNAFNFLSSGSKFVFTADNDLLFFADDGIHGAELWRSDGTQAGTYLVKDIREGALSSVAVESGTAGVINLYPIEPEGSYLFMANDGVHGNEWHITDGTAEGTRMVKDIWEGSQNLQLFAAASIDGKVYFSAIVPGSMRELWVSDGTEEGTKQITNIRNGEGNANITYITGLNGKVFFNANDGVHGIELWVYEPSGEVSLNQIEADQNVLIFPNPNNGQFTLKMPNHIKNALLTVFDSNCRLVSQRNISNNIEEINLSDFNQGIYMLRIVSDKLIYNKKVIVNY
jgi:ELWxxDGT repeat protein